MKNKVNPREAKKLEQLILAQAKLGIEGAAVGNTAKRTFAGITIQSNLKILERLYNEIHAAK